MKNFKRIQPSVSAGSMADIAFLLLIFFLITTTVKMDEGVRVHLPSWSDEEYWDCMKLKSRNMFYIRIDSNDVITIRGDSIDIKDLKGLTKAYIANPLELEHLAEAPRKAVISVANARGTSYDAYFQIHHELKAAYTELWEQEAQKNYQKPYVTLSLFQKKQVRKKIPLIISEAEPS